jgi:tetratricopeptide (TPR) repeat protein
MNTSSPFSPQDALKALDRFIALQPDSAEAYFKRGNILKVLQRPEEALASYDRAIVLKKDYAEVYHHRGDLLEELQRWEAALESYDQALHYKPDYAAAYCNRGNVLKTLQRFEEALKSYDRAIALQPGLAAAHYNCGIVLQKLNRIEEAVDSYDRMITLRPDYAAAHYNRGNALKDLRRLEEALASYDRVLAIQSDHPMANVNKALIQLLLGNYVEGWKLYEWRWKHELLNEARRFTQPLWLGAEPLENRTLLIHSEQGLGDAIQFCRYARLAEEKGAKVILEASQSLMALFKTLPGNVMLVEKGKPLPDFDSYCPLMSLPLAFKTTVETIPVGIPYLSADPPKRNYWRKKLGGTTKPKIGLVWSGSSDFKNNQQRSIVLKMLKPLLELPFEFHSLQVEYREGEKIFLESLQNLDDHSEELRDFSDTVALMTEMDLVISIDTAVAHLAGAMGKKVWVLLPYIPDFRWMLERSDSPWYPTAKLWRQPKAGDWETVIRDVVGSLKREYQAE